jgi:Exostosin family
MSTSQLYFTARPAMAVAQCLQNLSGYHIHDRDPFWERMMHTSVFHLCPRGNGPSSYRLYEALQADTIPIYIWDEVRLEN